MPVNVVDFPQIIDRPFLQGFVGKSIEDLCPLGFGKKGDEHNHCAHFVSHALGFRIGRLCSSMTWDGRKRQDEGRTMTVDALFNACPDRGLWSSKPADLSCCLIFAVVENGYDAKKNTMGEVRRKHVGIHLDGECYNYHNTTNEGVDFDGPSFFDKLYGKGTLALYGTFPV